MTRDRFEVIMKALADGTAIEYPRSRFEKIMSAIAVAIGAGGGEPAPQPEVIPFTAGSGTNSREFTFTKPVKFVGIEYVAATGSKMLNFSITAKAGGYVPYLAAWLDTQSTGSVSTGNLLSGYASFSEDLKTMTLNAASADVACNGSGSGAGGNIFVVY